MYHTGMNIESLNKSQIVLLTLLVSFVTSIATGIVTVALMDQAPPAITQTINRVVEHTVERIVPAQGQVAAAATPVKETVIVNQAEAIAQAVSIASPSVVRIVPAGEDMSPVAIGVAVNPTTIATNSSALKEGTSYSAQLADGTLVPLVATTYVQGGVALLTSKAASSTPVFTPISISRGQLQLGQTAIALTGLRAPRIASGIVTSLVVPSIATSTDATSAPVVETNIALASLASGTVFVNTDGALIGMYAIATDSVVPVSVVSSLLVSAGPKAAN
jgi:hypothetical protein